MSFSAMGVWEAFTAFPNWSKRGDSTDSTKYRGLFAEKQKEGTVFTGIHS